ncbi:hypothetical protein CMUS01_11015 [Colletotrichum musicola]|uniref:Uncharacterized protein n=1 Tax=Colletotrichum musicola TaxID=2175873 RepID=A0A8H6K0N1_9PEZI|nr:hypothetical protein CMUS01_11015 [Colletotrichum musicola]
MRLPTSFVAALFAAAALAAPVDDYTMANRGLSGLDDRQVNPPVCNEETKAEVVGDGNPKTWWLQKQVTREQVCGQNGCAVEASKAKSYTIEWGASISAPYGFVSGGLAVSKSVETGEVNVCEGDAGDHLCIYVARQAH